ncbi:MAG: GTPase Era [Gemmatimonadota bacterium]|nr:MAG: GTPase Era [Gemmatimonadota bacterium]
MIGESKEACEPPHRAGSVALAGPPNVGKSTLLNALMGSHLSIVSPKAQTTRNRVYGVLTGEEYQVLLIDAPGLIEARYPLQDAMVKAVNAAIREADVVTLVVDAARQRTLAENQFDSVLRVASGPVIVAVNKVDLVDERTEQRFLDDLERWGYQGVAVSAVSGKGLDAFLERVVQMLPESPPLYPPEYAATQPLRFFAAEFVRETCMELFREEVPYSVACVVEEFREDRSPIYVAVTIYVEKESQKGILIGQGGSAIKRVGARSRVKIEELTGDRVYLDLRVKVLTGWSKKPWELHRLGLQPPPEPRGGQKRE